MIKKLIISAVVLTALISGKEANAAGAAGFARMLSSNPVVQVEVAENLASGRHDGAQARLPALTFAQSRELLRVNSAVNGTISELDSYFADLAGGLSLGHDCLDCADCKRDRLISLGI